MKKYGDKTPSPPCMFSRKNYYLYIGKYGVPSPWRKQMPFEMDTGFIFSSSDCCHVFLCMGSLDITCNSPRLLVKLLIFILLYYFPILSSSKAWHNPINLTWQQNIQQKCLWSFQIYWFQCRWTSDFSYPYRALLINDAVFPLNEYDSWCDLFWSNPYCSIHLNPEIIMYQNLELSWWLSNFITIFKQLSPHTLLV